MFRSNLVFNLLKFLNCLIVIVYCVVQCVLSMGKYATSGLRRLLHHFKGRIQQGFFYGVLRQYIFEPVYRFTVILI